MPKTRRGDDASIYTVIEEIIERSGTPYFCFKDVDENKPTGSIKIRIETIAYFLKRYGERMVSNNAKLAEVAKKVAQFRSRLAGQTDLSKRQLVEV